MYIKKLMFTTGLHVHVNSISDISNNITAVCGSSGAHFNPRNLFYMNRIEINTSKNNIKQSLILNFLFGDCSLMSTEICKFFKFNSQKYWIQIFIVNQTHGDINAQIRHVGDYGNVVSDNNGKILANFTDKVSTLYGPYGVIGRCIVLHQLEDDLGLKNDTGSKTTGNSGKI